MKSNSHVPEVSRIIVTDKLPTKDRVNVPSLTIIGVAALILGLGISRYLERHTQAAPFTSLSDGAVEEDWSM
jgi:hypothetical protein